MANQENVRKWVDALRSGAYIQGIRALHKVGGDGVDRFCCLGVACAVAGEDIDLPVQKYEETETGKAVYSYGSEPTNSVLPAEVIEWLGLESPSPMVWVDGGMVSLVELNDWHRSTFKEIANLIQRAFLGADDVSE